jgi:hypothetical protein
LPPTSKQANASVLPLSSADFALGRGSGLQIDFGDDGYQDAGISVHADPFGNNNGSNDQLDAWSGFLIRVASNMLTEAIRSSFLSLFNFPSEID